MDSKQLNMDDTLVLKGIAIIAIMIHNFVHRIPWSIPENQHVFALENNHQLIECFQNGGPHLLLNLFSHYGHYGVPVFIFFSGYGLVLKYEYMREKISFGKYIRKHANKLWLLLLPLLIPHFLFLSIRESGYFQEHWADLILMMGFLGNFQPDAYVFHGPWWFFSLIAQLYVIYYIFVYHHTLKPIIILSVVCMAGQFLAVSHDNWECLKYLRYNFAGSMLPFVLGIVMARKNIYLTRKTMIIILLLFIVCCFNRYTWLLTFGLIAVAILPVIKLIRLNSKIYSSFKWIGIISAFLFVIHPIIRECIFGLHKYALYVSIFVYLALCVLGACMYRVGIDWCRQCISTIK